MLSSEMFSRLVFMVFLKQWKLLNGAAPDLSICTFISKPHVNRSISCFVSEIQTYMRDPNTCMFTGYGDFSGLLIELHALPVSPKIFVLVRQIDQFTSSAT
jgi:hypothetical protein